MKLLSLVIPCYNSQDYMERCIHTLLTGGTDVEILIINDGSTDDTGKIADYYASEYPDIIRAIHQLNGGHGEAINTGVRNAEGIYFKVVDSDDWVDIPSYRKILDVLRNLLERQCIVDMVISNFVYDKEGAKHKRNMHYQSVLPENRIFTWNETGRFKIGQYLLMHSIIYRTEILKGSGLKLPAHTFYVDNLFASVPLKYVQNMYYINVDFYHYYIGRKDQSVNETIMIKRIDQQIEVNKLMLDFLNLGMVYEKRLRRYLLHYLEIVTAVSNVMLLRSGTMSNLGKKKKLWRYIKEMDRAVYNQIRWGVLGIFLNLPGLLGRKIPVTIYRIARKVIGFN